jgi:DNA-binding MarR family transcriptional regulator
MAKRRGHGGALDAQDLRRAFNALVRRFGLLDAERTPCGHPFPPSHAHALMEMLHGTGRAQTDLAGTLGLSKSALSRMVTRLMKRGWVRRREDPEDGRVRRLVLTADGRRLARELDRASLARFSSILASVPAAKRAEVLRGLELLRRALPPCGEDRPVLPVAEGPTKGRRTGLPRAAGGA